MIESSKAELSEKCIHKMRVRRVALDESVSSRLKCWIDSWFDRLFDVSS